VVARFPLSMRSPLLYDGEIRDLGVKGGTGHHRNYSLAPVGEFDATGSEERVGSDATP
jgi:hypothetical protein